MNQGNSNYSQSMPDRNDYWEYDLATLAEVIVMGLVRFFALALVVFAPLAVQSAAAAATQLLGPAAVLIKHDDGRFVRPQLERMVAKAPHGTRVFFYDQYIITSGHIGTSMPANTQFRRDKNVILARDGDTGQIQVFPADAMIVREDNAGFMTVAPGSAIPASLAQKLRNGSARFWKQIAYYPDDVIADLSNREPDCDPVDVARRDAGPAGCGGSGAWVGGGSATDFAGITKSYTISCPSKLLTHVNAGYFIPATIVSAGSTLPVTYPVTASACTTTAGGGGFCAMFQNQYPNTSYVEGYNVSDSNGGQGRDILSQGLMFSGYPHEGLGTASAPSCYLTGGCS